MLGQTSALVSGAFSGGGGRRNKWGQGRREGEEGGGGGGREEFVKLLFQESQGEAKQAGLGLRSPLAPTWARDRRSQPRAAPPSARLPWENHRPHTPGGCLQGLACPSSRLRRETCLVLEGQRPRIEGRGVPPGGQGK